MSIKRGLGGRVIKGAAALVYQGVEMREEHIDIFQFIKASRNLRLWSHQHALPGLFLNTLGCPSHATPQPAKVWPDSGFLALGHSSGLACHVNRVEILRAVEKTRRNFKSLLR